MFRGGLMTNFIDKNGKKGTELSMNVIIIAAIALVVLVVIIMMVMNSSKKVIDSGKCSALSGGECLQSGSDVPQGKIRYYKDCDYEGEVCYAYAPGGNEE